MKYYTVLEWGKRIEDAGNKDNISKFQFQQDDPSSYFQQHGRHDL